MIPILSAGCSVTFDEHEAKNCRVTLICRINCDELKPLTLNAVKCTNNFNDRPLPLCQCKTAVTSGSIVLAI